MHRERAQLAIYTVGSLQKFPSVISKGGLLRAFFIEILATQARVVFRCEMSCIVISSRAVPRHLEKVPSTC